MKIKNIFLLHIYLLLAAVLFVDSAAFAFTLNFSPRNKQSSQTAAAKPARSAPKAAEPMKKRAAPSLTEMAQADKRIALNISRGAGEGEKFTIGAKPEFVKTEIGKTAQGAQVFAKDIGPVSNITDTKGGGYVYGLRECIDTAVKNHLPLQIAKKSVKLAEMRVFEARRNMLPSASIDYQEYHGRVNGLAYTGRKQIIEGQQPIFHGGELVFTMKQTETNLSVAKNDYNRIKNELVLQVKKAYYTFAKAKGNIKIQENLSAEVDKIVDMVTKQSAAGIASKIEVMNVASQAGQIKYQLASAEGDLAIASLILKQAMNVDPKEEVDVKDDLEFRKVEVNYEKALAIAMVNRPEIKINSLMIDYYNYGKGIAKAKLWPKVDLLGSWGLAKEEYASEDEVGGAGQLNGDANRKMEQQWYAGLKVGVPFWGSTAEYSLTKEQWVPVVSAYQGTEATTMEFKFKILDNLESLSGRQLAEVDFDRARQEFTKVRQDIVLEVREGCFNYQKALIQTETAANKVKFQTSDLEFMKLKRGMDEVPDSSVIESMIKLGQEKFGLLQALTDCHISLASINKAIGIEDYYKDE
ncbi:MAG: TolC family protein [Candidatus Omnitrophica bacterium]|nr:TolC family protein [Candidatus Omnitrophota bacterium]